MKPTLFVALAALVVVAVVILITTGHPVPTELWALLLALVTGGLGLAVPDTSGTQANLDSFVYAVRGLAGTAVTELRADFEKLRTDLGGQATAPATTSAAPAPSSPPTLTPVPSSHPSTTPPVTQ